MQVARSKSLRVSSMISSTAWFSAAADRRSRPKTPLGDLIADPVWSSPAVGLVVWLEVGGVMARAWARR